MSAPNLPKRVLLAYGNQRYSVEQTAERWSDQVLGDAPRDFAFHRFDAGEILRGTAADGAHEAIDAFQLACQTVPFLAERYLVRLDGIEAVRPPGRALATLNRNLDEMRVFRRGGREHGAWALEEDLPPGEPRGEATPVREWVREVEARGDGRLLIDPAPEAPDFLVSKSGSVQVVSFKEFLRAKLKGNFTFADEVDGSENDSVPAAVAGRLHQLLERFILNPPPDCWLLLTAAVTRETDLSTALLKAIKAQGTVEKFVTYDDYEPVDWVIKTGREKKLRLGQETAHRLIQLAGNDLGRLEKELEKLSLLFPPDSELDPDTLMGALQANSRHSLFWITERLGAKDLAGALAVLDQFLMESPNEYPVLIGILARFFRQLHRIRVLAAEGVGEREIASQLKLHPFIARKLAAQARRFSTSELEAALQKLAELDVALRLKSQLTAPLLKGFLAEICGNAPRRGGAGFAH